MMSTILYEDYVKIMLKTLKNPAFAHAYAYRPSGEHSTYSVLRWSQDGLRCLKMAQDGPKMVKMALVGPRWPKMARRWPKMASSWPQVGSTWVIRRSWRWLSVDDVVQK